MWRIASAISLALSLLAASAYTVVDLGTRDATLLDFGLPRGGNISPVAR